jgi:type II secretory pathway component GspD/PulD (secretin)
MVLSVDKTVKAVPAAVASTESPLEIPLPWRLLPASSSIMSRTVRLQNIRPTEALPALQPLANRPNSLLPIDSQRVLLLRDYSSNIRQQLQLLELIDQKEFRSQPNQAAQQTGTGRWPGEKNRMSPVAGPGR